MRVILASDQELLSELVTTTESEDRSGNKTYHPQRKDVEHNTDSWRCIMLAIRDLPRISDEDRFTYGGFAQSGYGGVGVGPDYEREEWKPPWS